VYFKDRIYIPEFPDLRHAIFNEYHSTALAGQSGLGSFTSFFPLAWNLQRCEGLDP
jgi:hypothetical protein